MRRTALILLCLAMSLSGCRQKHSQEFFDAEGRHSVLVARSGDDAYLDPEMAKVVEVLRAVPETRAEFAQAQALVARITAETARVAAAREALQAAEQAAAGAPPAVAFPSSPIEPSRAEEAPVAAAGVPDAGAPPPQHPWPGMSEAEFRTAFGACFDAARTITLPGSAETATAYRVADRSACTKVHGLASTSLIFVDKKMAGQITETTVTTLVDAGVRASAPPPAPVAPVTPPAPEAPTNPYDSTPPPPAQAP